MVEKNNVLRMLNHLAEARIQYIEDVKNSIKLYDEKVISEAVDYEIELPLIETGWMKGLRFIKIPNKVFDLVDSEYIKEDTEEYCDRKYRYIEISGIRFRPEF